MVKNEISFAAKSEHACHYLKTTPSSCFSKFLSYISGWSLQSLQVHDTRESELIRGALNFGFKTTTLSSCFMWTEDLGGRKNQGELTSRLRGHVCLFVACSSFPPPPISRALPPPPPPPSPPWWLLLILLLLLLVHVCVPTSLGVFDNPCDVPTTAFTSPPHFHNSLLPPCSLFTTAVILLCVFVDYP